MLINEFVVNNNQRFNVRYRLKTLAFEMYVPVFSLFNASLMMNEDQKVHIKRQNYVNVEKFLNHILLSIAAKNSFKIIT